MPVITKTLSSVVRLLEWLGSLFCVGVLSYFMVEISKLHRPDGKSLALEIISGAAVIYTTFMFVLSCCLLQKTFFEIFTVLMDLIFMGAFIAVAILLRKAPSQHCDGTLRMPTWLQNTAGNHAKLNCRLSKGVFYAAVGLAVLFAITALLAIMAYGSTKKDQVRERSTARSRFGRREKNIEPVPIVSHTHDNADAYTEKSDDLEANNIGREYRGTTVAPAVIPAPRHVAPMPAYDNTTTQHTTQYSELGHTQHHNLSATSPDVGGVTAEVYDNLHLQNQHVPHGINLQETQGGRTRQL